MGFLVRGSRYDVVRRGRGERIGSHGRHDGRVGHTRRDRLCLAVDVILFTLDGMCHGVGGEVGSTIPYGIGVISLGHAVRGGCCQDVVVIPGIAIDAAQM